MHTQQATLAAGKPVGQAPPPPVPVLPTEFNGTNLYDKPKRSKSLVARFGRSGRRQQQQQNAEHSDSDGGNAPPLPLPSPTTTKKEGPPTLPLMTRDENGRFDSFTRNSVEHSRPRLAVTSNGGGGSKSYHGNSNVRFDHDNDDDDVGGVEELSLVGGGNLSGTRSLVSEGEMVRNERGPKNELNRRPSVMQRLFSSKKKVSFGSVGTFSSRG